MQMPGQSWPAAAAGFLGMWVVMMVPMMLPSLAPALWRYRRALGAAGAPRPGWRVLLAAVAYLFVWTVVGLGVFPLATAMDAMAARFPLQPAVASIAVAAVVLIAGTIQFTSWKAHHLACFRADVVRGGTLSPVSESAWRHGLRLGVHCSHSCAGMTAVVLVAGMSDVRVMAVVTAAVTLERLAPAAERAARVIGAACITAAVVLISRANGLV
jgi:predicted metal-binding membrane protein